MFFTHNKQPSLKKSFSYRKLARHLARDSCRWCRAVSGSWRTSSTISSSARCHYSNRRSRPDEWTSKWPSRACSRRGWSLWWTSPRVVVVYSSRLPRPFVIPLNSIISNKINITILKKDSVPDGTHLWTAIVWMLSSTTRTCCSGVCIAFRCVPSLFEPSPTADLRTSRPLS